MKKAKLSILNLALFLSLMGISSFASGQTQSKEKTSRLVVSFYSICCGIDQKAKKDLDKFITRYEKSKRKRLKKSMVPWGKEGEIDYCFKLTELSTRNQKTLVTQVRALLKKSKLVHINENVACQNEQKPISTRGAY